MSDAFGHKPIIILGLLLYIAMGSVTFVSSIVKVALLARFFQGLETATRRIVSQVILRNLYSGQKMAQLISFVMVIVSLKPAVAPLLGEQMMAIFGSRAV